MTSAKTEAAHAGAAMDQWAQYHRDGYLEGDPYEAALATAPFAYPTADGVQIGVGDRWGECQTVTLTPEAAQLFAAKIQHAAADRT